MQNEEHEDGQETKKSKADKWYDAISFMEFIFFIPRVIAKLFKWIFS